MKHGIIVAYLAEKFAFQVRSPGTAIDNVLRQFCKLLAFGAGVGDVVTLAAMPLSGVVVVVVVVMQRRRQVRVAAAAARTGGRRGRSAVRCVADAGDSRVHRLVVHHVLARVAARWRRLGRRRRRRRRRR